MTSKIRSEHLERRAFVYVRQSTATQVFENTESTARQYTLAERACALGWQRDAVEVVDEDLGRSGTTAEGRSGFARLAEAVSEGSAGAILALEVSRLARCSQDWQRLLALCAVAQVVVIDEHAVYDPADCDDRLLLDLKGTMSEVELHWLSLRLVGARRSRARRGELRFALPTGYVWGERGIEMDPDEAVRGAIRVIFERFEIEPTAWAVVRWARKRGWKVPTRHSFADGTSELRWKPLGLSRLSEILGNPIYAGVYVYGRRPRKKVLAHGQIRSIRESGLDPDAWGVRIEDSHQGYIRWEQYLSNRKKLRQNSKLSDRATGGAPREGPALLAGLLVCGRCGRRMRPAYWKSRDRGWSYFCPGDRDKGQRSCWSVSGAAIDAAVEELFLHTVAPSELELSLAVEREVRAHAESLERQWKLRLEQAEYEARRAERRYMAVDPDNRVVARTLENDWEGRLRELEELRREYETARRARHIELSHEDRSRIRALARDLPSVWRAASTEPADRKAMLRLAIEAVSLAPVDVPKRQTHVRVQWQSGAVSELRVERPDRRESRRTRHAAIERLRELAAQGLRDEAIAERLDADGIPTGAGKSWDAVAVKWARRRYRIARTAPARPRSRPLPEVFPDGRYSIRGAAKRFGVSEHVVRRWVGRGLVPAERQDHRKRRRVWWLRIDRETAARLEKAARTTAKRMEVRA